VFAGEHDARVGEATFERDCVDALPVPAASLGTAEALLHPFERTLLDFGRACLIVGGHGVMMRVTRALAARRDERAHRHGAMHNPH
jgi:hypothetical protein